MEIFYYDSENGTWGSAKDINVIIISAEESSWPDNVRKNYYDDCEVTQLIDFAKHNGLCEEISISELLKLRELVSELRDGDIAYDRKSWQEFKDAAGNLDLW